MFGTFSHQKNDTTLHCFLIHLEKYAIFRYELREDRRKEIVRSSSHIDGVKKEILRTLSFAGGPRKSSLARGTMEKVDSEAETESSCNEEDVLQQDILTKSGFGSEIERMKRDIFNNVEQLLKTQTEHLKTVLTDTVEDIRKRSHDKDVVLVCTDC